MDLLAASGASDRPLLRTVPLWWLQPLDRQSYESMRMIADGLIMCVRVKNKGALLLMAEILHQLIGSLFIGFHASQVVQDFSHQQ